MSFSTKYVKLFEVEILHLYFLNKGTEEFDSMSEEDKNRQLDAFNFENFMRVQPSIRTQQAMNGYKLVFNSHGNGFSVWVKVKPSENDVTFVELDEDLYLTFWIKIDDYRFQNYTNMKFENAGETYYFSNKRLDTETNTFPLINESGDHSKIDESFILSDDGVKACFSELVSGEKSNLFGLIRIHMKGQNSSLNVVNAQGKIPSPVQKFELFFENRKTWWRYIFQSDQSVSGGDDVEKENNNKRILVTKTELPLTQKGFVSVELKNVELPNPGVNLIKPENSGSKIFSEIYM